MDPTPVIIAADDTCEGHERSSEGGEAMRSDKPCPPAGVQAWFGVHRPPSLVGRTGLEPVTNGLKVVEADFLFNAISCLQRLPMFEPNLTQLDS